MMNEETNTEDINRELPESPKEESKKIPSREIPVPNIAEETERNRQVIDDIGKLGKPFSDALMEMREMELSVGEDDEEQVAGAIDPSRPVTAEDMGFEFIEESDLHNFRFGCTLSGSTVTVAEGTIALGDVNYTVSSANVNLTGATCYVYVYLNKDKSAKGFGVETSFPSSAGNTWRWPLVCYSLNGATYEEVYIHRRGDITAVLALGGT